MINSICVICPGYPSEKKPYAFTFVDQLICAIADKGIKVNVIVPYDAIKEKSIVLKKWTRLTPDGHFVNVFSPAVLTLSTRKIGVFNFSLLSEKLFKNAALHIMNRYKIDADLLYAHFLFKAGTSTAAIGKKMNIPSVCAFGESSLWSIREIGIERARKRLSSLSGVIAVSTNNKNVLIKYNLVNEEKITVIPNAVNKQVFCPGDKFAAREQLGLPQDRIIGIYNGAFTHSKGSLRVDAASKDINNLSMVYLGSGKDEPQASNVLFKGRVAHEHVALWLKAADFFVLPTLEEGCCNAVVEAMSTGLPVITSDMPFNYDILDHDSAILIDPMDIVQLTQAISKIVTSQQLREKLSKASLQKSAKLDINVRAEKVIEFLNTLYKNHQED